ncbi:MAG: GGDEF domain-containing protein [Sulfuricaulis sp.]|nr:GGDEF domain-containing protein [Sulfuricaulis sp.]
MADTKTSADPSLLQSLKHHLEGLKRTEHGLILYNQIQRGLQSYGDQDGRIELVFVTFLHALLGKYATNPACDPATRVKARLIQQRLTLYLPDKPVAAAVPPAPPAPIKEPKFHKPPPRESKPAASPPPPPIVKPPPPAVVAPVAEVKPPPVVEVTPLPPQEPEPVTRLEKIEALGDALAEKVTASIAVDKQFGELLENERATIAGMESPLGEFNDMKQILVKGLNELIEERQALIEKLSSAGEYLKAVESDRERLRQELGKARKHGMSDELTGLPNRDVFIKQLESEIGRVKRYGFSLALAVIDVDNLEAVNKRYGRAAGDAVLRCYAGEILSKFRTYDLVARYSGDGFAVLFPNTQKDGAMHALEKARKTATSTFIHHEGKNIPLPSFSSVLTQYAAGEPAASLLKRADDTLIQAKEGGFNRMVVALPTS